MAVAGVPGVAIAGSGLDAGCGMLSRSTSFSKPTCEKSLLSFTISGGLQIIHFIDLSGQELDTCKNSHEFPSILN